MIKEEKIKELIFLTQTTYYIYNSEEDQKNDKPSIITSDKKTFDNYKKRIKSKK
jgi:hypothetical protein